MILSSYTRDIDGTHLMGQVIVSALKKSQGGARQKKNVFNTNGQDTLKKSGGNTKSGVTGSWGNVHINVGAPAGQRGHWILRTEMAVTLQWVLGT